MREWRPFEVVEASTSSVDPNLASIPVPIDLDKRGPPPSTSPAAILVP
jgi:hypothetical protein